MRALASLTLLRELDLGWCLAYTLPDDVSGASVARADPSERSANSEALLQLGQALTLLHTLDLAGCEEDAATLGTLLCRTPRLVSLGLRGCAAQGLGAGLPHEVLTAARSGGAALSPVLQISWTELD